MGMREVNSPILISDFTHPPCLWFTIFLKRSQLHLLSLPIHTFISISLSRLIETVLRFSTNTLCYVVCPPHTKAFIKNAFYKKHNAIIEPWQYQGLIL